MDETDLLLLHLLEENSRLSPTELGVMAELSPDEVKRRALIEQAWTEDAAYVDPVMKGSGHAGIDAMIAAAQAQFPGFRFAALGEPVHIAREIKRRIRERTELTASVGVAPNKLVAKIASDLRKPDGLVIVRTDEVTALLDPLPVRKLFGLGEKTAPKVEALGIHTLGDLRQAASARLRPIFGRYTERVQQRAAGIDDRPVIPDLDEKQISAEETFETDIADRARLQSELARLADKTCARLRARELVAGCVTVKIRRKDFTT